MCAATLWERCGNLAIFGDGRRLLPVFLASSFRLYARRPKRSLTILGESKMDAGEFALALLFPGQKGAL
jgi:hypothetical protein